MEQGIRIRVRIVFLLCLLLSGVSSVQAQSAGNIDTLSQWRVDSELANSYGVVYDQFKYFIDGDTVIGSTAYYKVYKSGYVYEWEFNGNISDYYYYEGLYSGVLREGSSKWYTTDISGEDVLLYDFTLNIGDSIYGGQITIVDIDTVMVGDEPKKRFHLLGAGFGGVGEYIIEDVGATTGLFEFMLFFENASTMYCYAVDFIPLWINPDNYPDCDLSVNIKENIKKESITCFPNPFTTSTTIEYELYTRSNIQYTVYNSIGEVVYQIEDRFEQGIHKVTWSPGLLPGGMYFGVLRSEEGVSVVKMVKR